MMARHMPAASKAIIVGCSHDVDFVNIPHIAIDSVVSDVIVSAAGIVGVELSLVPQTKLALTGFWRI